MGWDEKKKKKREGGVGKISHSLTRNVAEFFFVGKGGM